MFNMTRLALNGTRHVNAVSRIHGIVSARLCADQWPEIRPEDNPMGFVTNGVHVPTFLHQTWTDFFDRELSRDWRERLRDPGFWSRLEHVPDERYWPIAQTVKSRMLSSVRDRLQREYARKGMSPAQLRHVTRLLDPLRPNVLTIGFARRFATYKRATLLLRDRARLAKLVNNPTRPVLFLFAGKAHPADVPGQQVLREIRQLMTTPEFIGRIIFPEDYDLQLARWLVSGVDVWLNNPIAPLEASGTSGIKASINGRLNLSVLDGWWAEGWMQDNGWGIPPANVQDPGRPDALGILHVGRGDSPTIVLHPAFRPPAIEDAQVQPPIDGGLDAGGAARLERCDRVVEPDIDAGDQPARQLQIVVLEEDDAPHEFGGCHELPDLAQHLLARHVRRV